MENKQNNSGLKAAVVILALLLLGSIGYIFKMSSDNTKQVTELTSEKDQLSNDLKARIAELDLAISENTALKADFEAQKEEMTNLLAELEKSKGDIASLGKYRDSYNKLKREMDNLLAENKLLKEQNVSLTSSLDSTNVVLEDTKRYADTLLTQNDNLTKTVEKGSTLAVLNLNVLAVKERSSGKQIETDKASRADKLKVSFLIAENQIAKSGDRNYYVQIIDSKNNILGDKETITISPELTLTYSFITKVKYENKTVQVNEEVPGKDFAAGTYFVNVFNQKGEMVSKTSFSLR
jgi:outer membrane murein-binding lipoprotein Lpp